MDQPFCQARCSHLSWCPQACTPATKEVETPSLNPRHQLPEMQWDSPAKCQDTEAFSRKQLSILGALSSVDSHPKTARDIAGHCLKHPLTTLLPLCLYGCMHSDWILQSYRIGYRIATGHAIHPCSPQSPFITMFSEGPSPRFLLASPPLELLLSLPSILRGASATKSNTHDSLGICCCINYTASPFICSLIYDFFK